MAKRKGVTKVKEIDKEFLSQKFRSTGHMFSYISDTYGKSPSTPLHVFILLPIRDATVEKVRDAAQQRDVIFETKKISEKIYRVSFGVKIRRIESFLVIDDDWWMILTVGDGSRASQVLIESFVRNHFFPVLYPAYLEPKDMIEIVSNLYSIYDFITLEEYSMASERAKFRVWLKSGEKFTTELADRLQEKNDASFTGLKVFAGSNTTDSTKLKIYSKSRLCFLSGSFGDFYEFGIVPYIHRTLQNSKTYSNLERRVDDGKLKLFGVHIKGREDFEKKDIEAVKEFIQSKYSTVLVHQNPVIVIQASDVRDGSSYDIYITQSDIDVIPLSKSTSGSLIELCTSIVRILPPFVEFQPKQPTEFLQT